MKIDPSPMLRHVKPCQACTVAVHHNPSEVYPLRLTINVGGRTQRLYMTAAEATAFRFDIGMALCDPR